MVDAAVELYGEAMLVNLLQSLGRPGVKRIVGGRMLWRDACQAAGYDFDRIRLRYRKRLGVLADQEAAWKASIPR
ncbi:MAG: hypothetical protein AAF191_04160 [Verrucomicrobiota bacterium]